jgi:uncharacterized protein (DUF58 family)
MAKSHKYSDPEVLSKIGGLGLRARKVVEGTISGLHRSPFHGFNVEFAAYREYSPGDDLRRLDWRVLGRTDRHYIKEYEEDTNLRATLVVDASASMRYGPAERTKFDYAATLAASLATLLIEQRDPVGLALFDREERTILRPAATQAQLVQILGQLDSARPDRETDLGEVLKTLADRVRRRGLLIIISDLLTDFGSLADGLSRLEYRGHEVMIFQILDRDELELPFNDPVLFRDIEGSEELLAEPWGFRKAYQQAMQEFLQEVRDATSRRGIDHLLLLTDQNLGDALSHYLHARANAQHLRAGRGRRGS